MSNNLRGPWPSGRTADKFRGAEGDNCTQCRQNGASAPKSAVCACFSFSTFQFLCNAEVSAEVLKSFLKMATTHMSVPKIARVSSLITSIVGILTND